LSVICIPAFTAFQTAMDLEGGRMFFTDLAGAAYVPPLAA
jgi:hypothetical protein